MNQKKKEVRLSPASNISHIARKVKRHASLSAALDLCECLPLALDLRERSDAKQFCTADDEQTICISQLLYGRLHTFLHELFPRVEPLSLLVLHLSQRESTPLAPHSNLLHKRRWYHAPPGLLEQVLANVQRVIRIEDNMLLCEDTGFALVFPGVDQQGAEIILERIYSSICLLQAETLIPPLIRETTIALGMGTYPASAESLDMLYQQAGRTAQSLVLRPILTTQLRGAKPIPAPDNMLQFVQAKREEVAADLDLAGIPFMELPHTLPDRLTQLLPFSVAMELQCAPVGRDHHRLTVAMLDPTDAAALRRLQHVTGMTIFPVSCDESALHSLLTHAW